MKIKNVEIENNLILAPMAGVTDVGFRTVCSLYGAGATVTEMISAKGLYYDSKKTENLLHTTDYEKIKIVQLFGHEPEIFAKVINSNVLEKFDIIDLNMGCPAPKIIKNGDGGALLKDINLAKQIIETCVKNTTKPITVKFRMGWNENSVNAVEFAKMCESAGASAITIHARTVSQGYSGKADYSVISQVVKSVNIPVIANGDVCDINSYNEILKTGCSAVMIGRGALGYPEIFSILQNRVPNIKKLDAIKLHLNLLKENNGEKFTVLNMRKHFAWYLKGKENCAEIRNKINKEENFDNIVKIIENAFKE